MTLQDKRTIDWRPHFFLLIAIATALASILYGLSNPGFGGDSPRYLAVGKNILFNHCVSTADPLSAVCTPHWGGNQFPGYPLLIALAGWLAGLTVQAGLLDFAPPVIIIQSLLLAAAVYRLGRAAQSYSGIDQVGWAVALMAGFSPLHFAWSRWVLTETLSTALTLWLFAELLICLHRERLRIVPLALPLIAGFFVRYDSVTLCAAVAVVGFILHPPLEALRRGALIAVLLALPIAGWSARNVAQGLNVLPMPDYGVGHMRGQGYYDWLGTWVSDLYNAAAAAYPVSNRRYSKIIVPDDIFLDRAEAKKTRQVLAELAAFDGREMPAGIEHKFAQMAEHRLARDPIVIRFILPMKRAANMYFAPFYSFGWKIELGEVSQRAFVERNVAALFDVVRKSPLKIALKAGVAAYHFLVLAVFVFLIIRLRRASAGWPVLLTVTTFVIARTLFTSILGQADPRLTTQTYALMECTVLLTIGISMTIRRLRSSPPP